MNSRCTNVYLHFYILNLFAGISGHILAVAAKFTLQKAK
jgi:hypothetical protein